MSAAFWLWALALPVLLLPIWWHRQKRQRTSALPLATARFLPRSDPQQQRVWRWTEPLLLLLRCLLLIAVLAWLADLAVAWRGDTVLVGAGVDAAWTNQQIEAAGLKDAQRMSFCSAPACAVRTDDVLSWLKAHEREWRGAARLAVVANASDVPMPAHAPQLAHKLDLRIRSTPPAGTTMHHITLVSGRADQWRTLFALFESAGDGMQRYAIDDKPGAQTELIVWDVAQAPDQTWRAPLWWVAERSAFPELKQVGGVDGLRIADSARGRLWSSDAWPPKDVDGARALFESWRQLHYAPPAYGIASHQLAAGKPAPMVTESGTLREALSLILIVLFLLERVLVHVRRR